MTARDAARSWLAADPDPDTRAELEELLGAADSGDPGASETIEDAFSGPLTFGTAGLRGRMGAGPNRMNRLVVTQAAIAIADGLKEHGHADGQVLVGHDARHKSEEFARDTAEILAGAGFTVLLTGTPVPTPLVSFGIRRYGCVAGIVVTASHNPAADNGYKVYLGDGSQIIPPTDTQIAARIAAHPVDSLARLPRSTSYRVMCDQITRDYVTRSAGLVLEGAAREITWVHTAMHGVGARTLRELTAAAGFPPAHEVPEQAEPDPDFPTVAFPNPEEPGAIDMALALAGRTGADLVVANDPDADRCAIAAVVDDRWRMLTGDELGLLLADHMIRRGAKGVLASSGLLRRPRRTGRCEGTRSRHHPHRFQVDREGSGSRLRLRGGHRLLLRSRNGPGQGRPDRGSHGSRTGRRVAGRGPHPRGSAERADRRAWSPRHVPGGDPRQ